jgi:hypothetical protein
VRGQAAFVALCLVLTGCLDATSPKDPGATAPDASDLGVPQRVFDLLTPGGGDVLVIRTYHVEGRDPIPDAMRSIAQQLKDATQKRDVVLADPVRIDLGTTSTQANWTSAKAQEAFSGLDIPREAGTTNLVAILFDGYGYTSGTTARGFQAPEFIAIFPDTFRNLAGATRPVRVAVPHPAYDGSGDRQVILHEAGHMLGLVNNGLEMVHDHVDHTEACKCHSSNVESVMNTNVDLVDYALAGLPAADRFDADDLADIRALQQAYSQTQAGA